MFLTMVATASPVLAFASFGSAFGRTLRTVGLMEGFELLTPDFCVRLQSIEQGGDLGLVGIGDGPGTGHELTVLLAELLMSGAHLSALRVRRALTWGHLLAHGLALSAGLVAQLFEASADFFKLSLLGST